MTMTLAQETHQQAHRACNEDVRRSVEGQPEGVFPFICECNRDSCCTTVWLPVVEYDEARGYALPILARHHSALELEEDLPLNATWPLLAWLRSAA